MKTQANRKMPPVAGHSMGGAAELHRHPVEEGADLVGLEELVDAVADRLQAQLRVEPKDLEHGARIAAGRNAVLQEVELLRRRVEAREHHRRQGVGPGLELAPGVGVLLRVDGEVLARLLDHVLTIDDDRRAPIAEGNPRLRRRIDAARAQPFQIEVGVEGHIVVEFHEVGVDVVAEARRRVFAGVDGPAPFVAALQDQDVHIGPRQVGGAGQRIVPSSYDDDVELGLLHGLPPSPAAAALRPQPASLGLQKAAGYDLCHVGRFCAGRTPEPG
jgi:hypothetical protein